MQVRGDEALEKIFQGKDVLEFLKRSYELPF